MEAVQPEVAAANNLKTHVDVANKTIEGGTTTATLDKEVVTNATTPLEKLESDSAAVMEKTIPQSDSIGTVDGTTVTMEIDANKENPTLLPTSTELPAAVVDTNTMEQTVPSAAQPAVDKTEPAEAKLSSATMDANPLENVLPSSTEMECETATTLSEATPSDAPAAEANATNGLSLLATYGSDVDSDNEGVTHIEDSENEDVVEVPSVSSSKARRPVVAISSSSDSSSDSDSNSEGEYLTVLRKKIEKRINTENCDDDDDDDEEGDDSRPRRRQPPKVRGEMLLDELPPIDQLEITVPEDECVELGKVQSIVDQLVLVSVLPNSMLFDLDTVLFLDKGRKVLGQVFDVLGQVADPLYCVRFNTNQQIKDRGINIGDTVYCAPQTEHTQFVILSKLMQVRGSDASWEHDVEPPARFIDYSDDEAEREARWEQRKKRQRERVNSTDSVETVATTTTEASEAPSAPPRQRGRRGQRDNRHSQNYQNGNQQPHNQSRSQSRDSEYNYHPSYNPGSWHSNYYHNYHPPAANFNMMPGMAFPMPSQGYGYMAPPHPYAMPPPMPMAMPPHMYPPPPSHYGHPPHPPN